MGDAAHADSGGKPNVNSVDPNRIMRHNAYAGLLVGSLQSMLFNPWDRALYLSVKDKRPFLHAENFKHPFQGWMQSAVQRMVSGGLYFVLQGVMMDWLRAHEDEVRSSHAFGVGLVAGALNGAFLNPLAAIKYHGWGLGEGSSWIQSTRHAWKVGGPASFSKGMTATVSRDTIFGVAYEVGRHSVRSAVPAWKDDARWQFLSNMTCAALATILSSPFNYVRSIQYAYMTEEHRPAWAQFGRLWANAKREKRPLLYLQQRLRIGWGTTRVAVGMAFGQFVFSKAKDYLSE